MLNTANDYVDRAERELAEMDIIRENSLKKVNECKKKVDEIQKRIDVNNIKLKSCRQIMLRDKSGVAGAGGSSAGAGIGAAGGSEAARRTESREERYAREAQEAQIYSKKGGARKKSKSKRNSKKHSKRRSKK